MMLSRDQQGDRVSGAGAARGGAPGRAAISAGLIGRRLAGGFFVLVIVALVALVVLFGVRTAIITKGAWEDAADSVFPEACITQAVKWAADGEPVYRALDG